MLYLLLSIILAAVAWVGLIIFKFSTDEVQPTMSGLIRKPIENRIINGTLSGFFVLACFGGIYILSGPIVLGLAILGPISVAYILSYVANMYGLQISVSNILSYAANNMYMLMLMRMQMLNKR